MTPYVVDASIVIKWFVDEVHAEAARRLQEDQYELSAPDLLWLECGNILWKKVRRRELTPDEARLIWGGLEQQPISAFPSRLVLDLALEVAFDTNRTVTVTVYDCCYLALAVLTGCRLVTADQKLFNALQDGSYAMHVCWVANLP
jgi:predicted nucleic acid-binding protein